MYSVEYTSDENGFIPTGEHIIKPILPLPVAAVPEESHQPIETLSTPAIENRLPEEVRENIALINVNNAPSVRTIIDHGEHGSGLLRSESIINPDGSYHYR